MNILSNRIEFDRVIHAPRPRYAINWSLLHPQTPSAPPNPIPPEHHQTPFVHQPVHQDPAPTGTHPPLPPRPLSVLYCMIDDYSF